MKPNSIFHKTVLLILILVSCSFLPAQTRRPMELDDLFRIKRVSDPQISPDGKWIAFVLTTPNTAANTSNSDIYLMPASGGGMKPLAGGPKQERHPRWSPDGKWILFESNRNGSYQLYRVSPDGGEPKQLTTISTEAGQGIWSPDGKWIAFVSAVYPEFSERPFFISDSLNREKLAAKETSKVKAHVMTKLLYKHWDSWVDDLRQHVFIMYSEGGDPHDVTPGENDGVPTSTTFSAGDDFDFSPDGNELAYEIPPVPVNTQAWSTNHDIYTVNLTNGNRKQLTANPAADGTPRYSPDGKYILYRAQARPGFEADRWQLMLYNRSTHTTKSLTKNFDAGVDEYQWMNDSKTILFLAEEKAARPIWTVTIAGNDVKKLVGTDVNGDISVTDDGTLIAFSRNSFLRPAEIYTVNVDGSGEKKVSAVNDELFAQISMTPLENVTYKGAGGTPVQMWIVKPPDFNPKAKYPLVYWVHGGPQGAWLGWSFRWCPELWAAQGYVLALPNPRGSTGFGQKFLDQISHDWGGKVYTDVMNGLAFMENKPYIDKSKMAAAGASYGGYMMNWFEGHTNKFKTIVSHDGVYNFSSEYGMTDELWFDEWEHGIPWKNPGYDKFSPNKFAANFKTPMLIIHSEKDYRVPVGEGMQLFTALQRQGIPSEFLSFPDEGHWILKPANSEFWHKTVFEWIARYLKP